MALYRLVCVAALLSLLTKESHSQSDVCGLAPLNTKIVGGQVSSTGSWPWQVSLRRSGSHFCGGSLINNQWVLTAAHCFKSTSTVNLAVALGVQTQEGTNPNEQLFTVSQIINHPSYNTATYDNDICLLKLSSQVTFNNYIRPVCLAAPDSTLFSDVNVWVTGWGRIASGVDLPSPQNLMEVQVPIVGNKQCNCDYGVGRITDNMICAGLRAGGKDSCQGDSGGPLVIKQNSRWIQSGVVSFGEGCALPNYPGVYTRVSQYQTWINSQITSNQPGYFTFTSTGTDGDLSVICPTTTTTTSTTTTPTTTTPTTTTPTTTTPTTTSSTTSTPTTSTTPKPVVCGQAPISTRILGGNTTSGTWPWMVSLQRNGSHVCGGTLVAVESVLSDANCFSSSSIPSQWTVVLGRLTQYGSNPNEVTLNVTNITLSNLTGSNVAVLRLGSKPTLSNYIQPICLDNGRTFAVGSTCWAAGWSSGQGGVEQVLQEVQTTVVDCGNLTTSSSICMTLITLDQSDAGGPIMCKLDGSWFQAAVLTVNNNSSSITRAAGVWSFTKLSTFSAFLTQTLGTILSPASSTNTTSNTTTAATTVNTTVATSGGFSVQSSFIFLHLLVFIRCLHTLL